MGNRLRSLSFHFSVCVTILFNIALHNTANAQCLAQDYNILNPPPDTIYTGPTTCKARLDWAINPSAVYIGNNPVTCSIQQNFGVNPNMISGGFSRGDSIPAGTIVTLTYNLVTLSNTIVYTFDVAIVDTIRPYFTTPAPADNTSGCQVVFPGALTAIDNCDGELTISPDFDSNASDCAGGIRTWTWTATDSYGNSTSVVQHVTVLPDTEKPTFQVAMPADLTIDCQNIPAPFALQESQVMDNCTSQPHIDRAYHQDSILTGPCPIVYQLNRTWTITDACGNARSYVQHISVQDFTKPYISSDTINTIVLDCAGPVSPITVIQNWYNTHLSVQDTCGSGAINWSYSGFTNNNLPGGCSATTGQGNVTYIANDGCNVGAYSVNFTVQDTTPPDIIIPAATQVVACDTGYVSPFNTWLNTHGNSSVTDYCTSSSGPNGLLYTYEMNGTSASKQQIIDSLNARVANPGCQSNLNIGGTIYNKVKGYVTVKFIYADPCGNDTNTVASFIVIDQTPPVFTLPAKDTALNCNFGATQYFATWLEAHGGAATGGGCSPASANTWYAVKSGTFNINTRTGENPVISDGCGFTGSATVDFFVEDPCGNINPMPQTATYSIIDTIGPVFTQPPVDLLLECNGTSDPNGGIALWLSSNGGLGVTGTCQGVNIVNNYMGLSDSCGATGTAVVTFTASDPCGISRTATATVRVRDTKAPVWSLNPADITISCPSNPANNAALNNWLTSAGGGTATDACGMVSYSNNYTTVSGGCSGTGSTFVTFTATDECGNFSTKSAKVTLIDNTPPVWNTSPATINVSCNGPNDPGGMITTWLNTYGGASVSDACSAMVSVSNNYSGISGCGNQPVVFTATDGCGNTALITGTISVIDTIAPQFSSTAHSLTLSCNGTPDPGGQVAVWLNAHGGAVATDACGSVSWTNDYNGINIICGNAGFAAVHFTAQDACGNSRITTATLVLQDTSAPFIQLPAIDRTVVCGIGNNQDTLSSWIKNRGGAVLGDVCSTVLYSNFNWFDSFGNNGAGAIATGPYPSVPAGNCDWDLMVIFHAEDDCGNQTSFSGHFTVIDTIAPVISASPPNITVDCGAIPPIDTFAITTTDNCATIPHITLVQTSAVGACSNSEIIKRTWTVTDDCNNTKVVTQTITVTDLMPPTLGAVPTNVTVACDSVPAPPGAGTLMSHDNCDNNVDIVFSQSNTQVDNIDSCGHYTYTITRNWTATDNCGNSATYTQQITVEDHTAPSFTVPADVTVSCEQVNDLSATGNASNSADNCDTSPSVSHQDAIVSSSGLCANYVLNRTWTVTDACGNAKSGTQKITVIDITPPSFSTPPSNAVVGCTDNTDPDMAFANWVASHGNAHATDNCGDTTSLIWYAMIPGSYNIANPTTFANNISSLGTPVCPSNIPGVYRQQTVDFIVSDPCGNATVLSATFNVQDTVAPVLQLCPQNTVVGIDPGFCSAAFTLLPPAIIDECGSEAGAINLTSQQVAIHSSNPGDENIPVNAIPFSFNVPSAPTVATGSIQISFLIKHADTEQPTEYFNILAEDGSLLGHTLPSANQCDTAAVNTQISNITPAQINDWAADGVISFTLQPNIPADLPGAFSVNDICQGAYAQAHISYTTTTPSGIIYEYNVNGGARIHVSPVGPAITTLPVGENTITYFATDCAGNQGTCQFGVKVIDNSPPAVDCPAPVAISTGADNCTATLTLPLPDGFVDDCGSPVTYLQTQPSDTTSAWLHFSLNPNYLEYISGNKTFTFTNVAANATGSSVHLTLSLKGDVNNPEEYFRILGEDGSLLGTTSIGQPNVTPGNCSTPSIITFTIPSPLFNNWASDGTLVINAISNTTFSAGPPGGPEDGINPCTTFAPGTPNGATDSTSYLFAHLEYSASTPSYQTSGATTTPLTPTVPPAIAPLVTFAAGVTTVTYQVTDQSGNTGTCTFDVTVTDLVPPVANCGSTTIFINPSGLVSYTLNPEEINLGSHDNCGGVTLTASPNVFTCSMGGMTIPVVLTATDGHGLSDTCTALVHVATEGAQPSFTLGLCGNQAQSLYLYANPPTAQGNIIYTYQWSGPNGFVSTDENPVIPNASVVNAGSYVVTVTGITGCTSIGVVQVPISNLPNTPVVTVSSDTLCNNELLTLQTQPYNGGVVQYQWYNGFAPNGLLLGITPTPSFFYTPPVGSSAFYVVITVDGCTSNPSASVIVNVVQSPIATVNLPVIDVCSGSSITLGTPVTGQGLSYSWTGPNGYVSNAQQPPVILNATTANAGPYTLVITANGCTSNPASTMVNVLQTPDQPQLSSPGNTCEGTTLTLLTDVIGADFYTWTSPTFNTYFTNTGVLVLNNAATTLGGVWTVSASQAGCTSLPSASVNVPVYALPVISAGNNGPVCEGASLSLFSNNISNALYSWTGPDMFTSILQNPVVNPVVEGTYQVLVTTQEGCSSTAQTEVVVRSAPEITAISDNAPNCTNGSDNVTFFPTVFPIDDGTYTYNWIAPNGSFFSAAANPVIPAASAANNGTYTLTISNIYGCTSDPVSHVLGVTEMPATPFITASSETVCEGQPLLLTATAYTGNVEYTWNTPLGTLTTSTPSLMIQGATPAGSGEYSVTATVNGCPSNVSPLAFITVVPTPATPLATGSTSVCEGQSLSLETPFIANMHYEWTGPNFSSSLNNPVIPVATEINEGCYKVRLITQEGCPSLYSQEVCVQVNSVPAMPMVLNNGPVCIDAQGASVVLSIAPGTTVPDATYTWYNSLTNQIISGPSAATIAVLNDFSGFFEGAYDFYAVTNLNGCNSLPSAPSSVVMNEVPANQANAGQDTAVCSGQGIILNATNPSIGSGYWTQLGGNPDAIIANPGDPNTSINGLFAGQTYIFQWTLSNGACTDYSSDEVNVAVGGFAEPAMAGDSIYLCNETTAVLNGNSPFSNITATWSQPPVQEMLGVVIQDPNNPNTAITGMVPGNAYIFTWTFYSPGCGATSSSNVIVTITKVSSDLAHTEADFYACGEVSIHADIPATGLGHWSTPDPDIAIISPELQNTAVTNLKPGDNLFFWTLSNDACGEFSSDTLIVTYEPAPVAVDDSVAVSFGGKIVIPVTANDDVPGDFIVEIASQANHGTATANPDGTVTYQAQPVYSGPDEFYYRICAVNCPDVCSTAKVILSVGLDARCDVPTIITPNEDGVNDAFVIPCFETDKYPLNSVSIFNQWGDEVFNASPYENNWKGTYDGEPLPAGTYFFIVKFNSNEEPKTGFLIIQR